MMPGLSAGVVTAANFDLSYTVQYDSDGALQAGVLHNDVLLVSAEKALRVAVRDSVVVGLQGQHTATVIQCLGERIRVAVHHSGEVVMFSESNVLQIRPVLREALGAESAVVRLFYSIDDSNTGRVIWRDTCRILDKECQAKGGAATTRKMREACFAELHVCSGRSLKNVLGKVVVEDGEMRLGFADFDFVYRRLINLALA